MPIEKRASKAVARIVKKGLGRTAGKRTVLNIGIGKPRRTGPRPSTAGKTFGPVIQRMTSEQRDELRRASTNAAKEAWDKAWDPKAKTGWTKRGETRPYAFLGKAKLNQNWVKLDRILFFLEQSNLPRSIKQECTAIWNNKSKKQRQITLKTFADEALQVRECCIAS